MNEHLARLKIAILSDKRKAGILAALVVVGVGMWIRAAVVSSGPSRARAESPVSDSAAPSSHGAEKDSSKASESARPEKIVPLPASPALERDLFRPSAQLLPPSSQTDASDGSDAKSAIGNVETPEERERMRRLALVRSVQEEASRLRLRSVMVGASPIAVIERPGESGSEGKVVRVGDEVAGFTVDRIERERVLLSRSGVEVELVLSLPRER